MQETVCLTRAQRDAQKADDTELKNIVQGHAGACTGRAMRGAMTANRCASRRHLL